MFTGETGVGKTVLAISCMKRLSEGKVIPVVLNFSAQTSSLRTQEMIEGSLDKRKKTQLGAPVGKTVIVFIDDVNMPKLDTYGSQAAIELLRFARTGSLILSIICQFAFSFRAPPGNS